MQTSRCSVCLQGLNEDPFQRNDFRIVSIRNCGHVLHRSCAVSVREQYDLTIHRNAKHCPLCRVIFTNQDLNEVFIDFADEAVDCVDCENKEAVIQVLQQEVAENQAENFRLRNVVDAKEAEIASLKQQINQLKTVTPAPDHGSRIYLQKELPDSTCFNCESVNHSSNKCPTSPIIRCVETTKFDKWAPIENFKISASVNFKVETAGSVIEFYTKRLNIANPTRAEIQAMYGFSFFNDCCWKCASPFHHRPDCQNNDSGIKKLCKRLYEINNPPSAELLAKQEYFRHRARERD